MGRKEGVAQGRRSGKSLRRGEREAASVIERQESE